MQFFLSIIPVLSIWHFSFVPLLFSLLSDPIFLCLHLYFFLISLIFVLISSFSFVILWLVKLLMLLFAHCYFLLLSFKVLNIWPFLFFVSILSGRSFFFIFVLSWWSFFSLIFLLSKRTFISWRSWLSRLPWRSILSNRLPF